MDSFPASAVTGRAVIRTDFMTDGAALQRIRRCVMTACTAVMNLVVPAVDKGRRWIRMAARTRRCDRDIAGGHMIDTMINIRNLSDVTGGTGDARAGCDDSLDR